MRVGRNAVAVDPKENMVRYVMMKRKEEKDADAFCADYNCFREYRIKMIGELARAISNEKRYIFSIYRTAVWGHIENFSRPKVTVKSLNSSGGRIHLWQRRHVETRNSSCPFELLGVVFDVQDVLSRYAGVEILAEMQSR